MTHWYGNTMDGWDYALVAVGTVLFWVLLIGGVVALVRYFTQRPTFPGGGQQMTRPTPEQLLAERFARGELDENEYLRAMDTLRQHHSSTYGGW